MPSLPGGLRHEIRQGRPFASPQQECLLALLRTADRLRRALGRVVEPRGITLQQYNVLRILRGAGAAGLPTLDIAQRMIESTPGITRLLDRLEAKALVRRRRCSADRRQVLCFSTRQGLALLRELDRPMLEKDALCLAPLRKPEMARLLSTLERVRRAADTDTVTANPIKEKR